jgi:cytochrome c oxidase subunit 3
VSEMTGSAVGPVPAEVERHHVGHHWSNAEQEFSSAKLGLWLFLATELLMFGGLFVAYFINHAELPRTFYEAHLELSKTWGTVNTAVLIFSSFSMAMAIRSAMVNKQKQVLMFLVITFLCAATFMVIKLAIEWPHKFELGTLPGHYYTYQGLRDVPKPWVFWSLYFMMTGLHGIHVLLGMVVIGWLIVRASKNQFYSGYYTPLEMTGLYWHLVDLIWIFLFPLFYLVG